MTIKKLKQDINFLEPVFKDNYCAVCFSSSEYYTPYLTVAIDSLIFNSNPNINYDIVVLTQNISEINQQIIKKKYEKSNISIRFYKVNDIFENTNIYVPTIIDTVTLETYYRILVPFIMKSYSKVLFLDSDMLILSDVNELYKINIEQYALAATHEILLEASHINACYIKNRKCPEDTRRQISESKGVANCLKHVNNLGVMNTKEYFQAGLILFNCNYFNKYNFVEQLFENIQKRDYKTVDQDALNELCYKKVLILNGEWNFTPFEQGFFKYMREENKKIQLSVTEPKIIHFVGDKKKPWDLYNGYYHKIWWEYARKTPFYEDILSRSIENKESLKIKTINFINDIRNYRKVIIRYWICKFLCIVTFGAKKQEYQDKKIQLKKTIKLTKKLRGK